MLVCLLGVCGLVCLGFFFFPPEKREVKKLTELCLLDQRTILNSYSLLYPPMGIDCALDYFSFPRVPHSALVMYYTERLSGFGFGG